MEYSHESFNVANWHIDHKAIEIITELSKTGLDFISKDIPKVQAIIMTYRDKSIPIAWIILEWEFENIDRDENKVISYKAEDKYIINPNEYYKEGICDIVGYSFCLFFKEFKKRLKYEKIMKSFRLERT